jgi:hypothetical protein
MFDAPTSGHTGFQVESGDTQAVVGHASGVLAERFGVDISTAEAILAAAARCEKENVLALAAAIVGSCTDESIRLPRRLYDA